MLKQILIIAFFLFLTSTAFGQKCGAGLRTFKVYTLNGQEAQNLQYEYFPLTPKGLFYEDKKSVKFIEDTLFPERENKIYSNFYGPEIIENDVAEKFIKNFKVEGFYDLQKESDVYFQEIKKVKLKGDFNKGTLRNLIGEMYLYNFLMKISSSNYPTVYIAGTHFGLCSRTEILLLEKENSRLILD